MAGRVQDKKKCKREDRIEIYPNMDTLCNKYHRFFVSEVCINLERYYYKIPIFISKRKNIDSKY